MNWKRLVLSIASSLSHVRNVHSFSVKASAIHLRGGSSKTIHKTMATATTEATSASTTMTAYQELLKELDAIKQLSRVSSILGYDKMVFMPAAASVDRGKQAAALASVIHERSTCDKIGALIRKVEAEATQLSEREQRNLELAKKNYLKASCVPNELAARKAQLSSEAYSAWAKARQEDDFSLFSNVLSRCIETAIHIAKCEQQGSHEASQQQPSVYATMLDTYETGMDPTRIDAIFAQIKQALIPLIDKVLGEGATPPSTAPTQRHVAVDAQQQLASTLVQSIGYDASRGRIDVSVHPFTSSSGPFDVRITSRFSTDNWREGLIATLHEGGHAMYEQHIVSDSDSRSGEFYDEPIQEALSMGMHESQSIFWERHVGLSKAFWEYATPMVNEQYGFDYTAKDYYGAVNAAKKSLIRVEADELTYPLHVILRYEIESDFVKGELQAAEIPARWNASMKQSLGVNVPSDAKGCLQDIHWSMLAYGYFPTYLIGAATAAQLEHYLRKDIPDFEKKVGKGEFVEIKAWLTEKVHKHGKFYKSIDDHLEAQLGEKLNPEYYIRYLTNKYTELYKC
ncbi:hypothetical protein MPSEU_000626100 [Mayamaea pseudoterrestris]|nr:hypothetical protein MPSEU_000626100 [Mayamaea pseudoterrestris]